MLGDPGPAELQHHKRPDGRQKLECRWVDIGDPTPTAPTATRRPSTCRAATRARAKFMGLEGGTFSKGSCYFTASDGGDAGQGQIWSTRPTTRTSSGERSQLVYASPRKVLDRPDAIARQPARRHRPLRGRDERGC